MGFAAGGMKPGFTIGKSDDFGFNVVEDPMTCTPRCLGLDYTRLTHKFQGRDFRLTDVHSKVVTKLLA